MNKLVLRNHFPWPIANLLHKDKDHLALRNNFRVTKKFLITKFNWQNVPICVFLCKQTTMSVKIFWRYSHLSFGGPQLYNSEALPYNFLIKTNYKSNCAISTWKISKNHFAIFDSFEKMKLVLNVRDINGLVTALHWMSEFYWRTLWRPPGKDTYMRRVLSDLGGHG